ncbi:hypothetical protein I6F26_11835 [Ensifer sp. IC3342]|nr:hypothetical protein [Ensifer sp. BRP08]MCA1447265.1 hypothetical protein [Ensifer sp. IC3342]
MMTDAKLCFGTVAWFEMVGMAMCDAASRLGLSPTLTMSLVEHYTDGSKLPTGLLQGLRFEISAGVPSFRVGVLPGERGDVTIEITSAAAHKLNSLHNADPEYRAAINGFLNSGEMRVDGDPARLGGWLEVVHDRIVANTR